LVPELERRLGIHPSLLEWAQVETVQDLLALAQAHVLRGQFSVDLPRPAV
jgi:acyl carrier protein